MTSLNVDTSSHPDHSSGIREEMDRETEGRDAGLEKRQECEDKEGNAEGSVTPLEVIRALGTLDSCMDLQNFGNL